jgi:hypothetical protein
MKRLVPRTLLATAAVLTLGLVGASGCADNRSSLYVVGVLAAPTGSDCGYTFDPGQPRIGRGRLDVGLSGSYTAVLLVGNQLVPQGNNDQLRSETSRVDLLGAEVTLTRVGGGQVASFTTNISGSVNPAPSAAPGYYGADVVMIPQGLNPEPGEYLASVVVFGRTLGGQDIETGDFNFPIEVCNGCLVVGVEDDGICRAASSPEDSVCTPGQDNGAVFCDQCVGRLPACGQRPPGP